MGVGVIALVSARQSFPLSVENNGKGHGKKTTMVQSTSHTKPTRLSASLHSGCYLGWLLLVSLRRLLLLRFFVVQRSRCHSVTVNRSHLNSHSPINKIPLPHAISQPPRLYSYMSSMHPAISRFSPLTFHKTAYAMHRLRLSRSNTSNSSCSLWTLTRPVVLE